VSDEMSVRAGLWPRAIALFIDGCLITFVLGFLGLVLFVPTGGRIRVADTLVGSRTCTTPNLQVLQDLNIPLPPNFQVTHLARCTKSLLGYVHDRVLIVAEITRSGATTITRELTFPPRCRGPADATVLSRFSMVSGFCGLRASSGVANWPDTWKGPDGYAGTIVGRRPAHARSGGQTVYRSLFSRNIAGKFVLDVDSWRYGHDRPGLLLVCRARQPALVHGHPGRFHPRASAARAALA